MSGKHTRLRYYTTMEEATVVRVWREYMAQIPSYSDNLPIFSDVSQSMQQCGIRLNKQEVRRRISSYRNKYLAERGKLEADPEHVTEWRLYPLVDCLFNPERPKADIHVAQNALESAARRVRGEQPDLPNIPSSMSRAPFVKFERDPDGCAFLEAPPAGTEPAISSPYLSEPLKPVKTEPKPLEADDANSPSPTYGEGTKRRTPLTPANYQLPMDERMEMGANGQMEYNGKKRRTRRSIMPRTGQISLAQLEELRLQNGELQRQNDNSLLELEFKERQYNELEQTLDLWMHQQEVFLLHFDRLGFKSTEE